VGFNAGSSALVWLTAGAQRVISFELGQYPYSSTAAGWLQERFPGRLEIILGDSLQTLPSFHAMRPGEKCDLMYVDGGHSYEHAEGDLTHYRPLARGQESVVLVDDTNMEPVSRAWGELLRAGGALEEGAVTATHVGAMTSPISDELVHNQGSFEINIMAPDLKSSMAYGRFV
jgi:hypothetical protein